MEKTQKVTSEDKGVTLKRNYAVVLKPCEEGGYVVTCPALREVITQGETVDEALAMVRDAIELVLAYRSEKGEEIPPDDEARLERVSVQIEAA